MIMGATDWHAWHADYNDPNSSLSARLAVVQGHVRRSASGLDRTHRILSLCAGEGRDVIPVLAAEPREQRPQLILVELDERLAAAARQRAVDAGVETTVIVGDAGAAATWRDHTPVDLLMLCGIFGNISEEDIRRTITAAQAMVVPRGTVIWTRGAFSDRDLRPQVRRWFRDAGFDELAYDAGAGGYGVGTNLASASASPGALPARLFTFNR